MIIAIPSETHDGIKTHSEHGSWDIWWWYKCLDKESESHILDHIVNDEIFVYIHALIL